MIAQPRFDDTDFQREQKLQLSELESGPDNVSWIAGECSRQLLYGEEHPLASPGLGYTRTVESLRAGQVQTFYRDHFTPQRGVLIVVGDVETTALLEMLESKFARWQGTPAAAVQLPPLPTRRSPRYRVSRRQTGGRAKRDRRRPHVARAKRRLLFRHPDWQPRAGRRFPEPHQSESARTQRLHLRRPIRFRLSSREQPLDRADVRAARSDRRRAARNLSRNSTPSPAIDR